MGHNGHAVYNMAGKSGRGLRLVNYCLGQKYSFVGKILSCSVYHPFPKREILDSSKLKEFAYDNLKFDENGRKFSKRVENTVGKGENGWKTL